MLRTTNPGWTVFAATGDSGTGVFDSDREMRQLERKMNEDSFNMELRKFLKKVGVTSQREIEQAVNTRLSDGRLTGSETLTVQVTLEIAELGLSERINGTIALE